MRPRMLLLALAMMGLHGELAAQSLFNAAGMGLPSESLDGRARALGNLGIGLGGASFMPTDPAAIGRYRISTGIMAGQPSWVDYTSEGGPSGSFQGNRFPLMGIAYPIFSGMASIQLGSFLDQVFHSESSGSVQLASGPVETTDAFDQDGSVSSLSLGYARMVSDDISVGVTLGRYAGSVVRTFTRTFGGVDEVSDVDSYLERGTWGYSGHSLTAGVAADLTPALRVAGSLQLPTALHADASAETGGADGDVDLPIQYRVGASATVASGLVVSGSAVVADWSGAGDDLVGTSRSGNSNGFGFGVEFSRARLLGKDAPLRFGFRRVGLPFSFDDENASERVFSGGFGLVLNTTNGLVLAGSDFAIERGRRTGGGIMESFWRATVSLVVSGF